MNNDMQEDFDKIYDSIEKARKTIDGPQWKNDYKELSTTERSSIKKIYQQAKLLKAKKNKSNDDHIKIQLLRDSMRRIVANRDSKNILKDYLSSILNIY